MPLLQTLQLHQLPIPTPQRHQLGMRAPLRHNALINHIDDIGLLDGAEPMRNGDGGAAPGCGVEGGLDDLFRFRVEGAGGFVEEEDLRVAEEGAGDG
jgi:hypothetical protein